MKKFLSEESNLKRIITIVISGTILLLVYFLLSNISPILSFLKGFIKVLTPFIWGLCLAYLLSYLRNWFISIFPSKWKYKTKNYVASILSISLFVIVIIISISILLPQLIASCNQLITLISDYINNGSDFFDDIAVDLNVSENISNYLNDLVNSLLSTLLTFLRNSIANIWQGAVSSLKTVSNIIIGIIIALYILIDSDHLLQQTRTVGRALFNTKGYNRMSNLIKLSADKFGSFITGKLLDSLIIGIICFIAMALMNLDYAVLISFVIGITNIIPFFGPFIGAIPSAFILLINDPWQALWFIIMIIILQQIDGNIIGPHILGDSVGLSSLWIMFAILFGSSYFGFAGMILGVPVVAVFYFLFKEFVNNRIETKGLNKEKADN